ncbi:MAG: OmpA family protein [Pedobacter sp.]|nr:MAG: OmpA family protein [Pedobacter sp.]
MAELDVQPKKKNPIIWIIGIIALLAVLFLLFRGCGHKDTTVGGPDSPKVVATTVADWDSVDFNIPASSYDEITDKGIETRGNEKYSIYGLGENILFATGQSSIRPKAEQQLSQIAASLKKRFSGASLAVYGNTDSTGNSADNKKLGEARAEAVKQWLVETAGIEGKNIAVRSHGESSAHANNSTAEGRKLNRNVQIVAMANN